jgi:hypothetical protein
MTKLFSAIADLGIHDPAESENPDIIDLYNFWLSKRDTNGLFEYHRFDVLDLPARLVSKIELIKVRSDGTVFELQIVGGDIIENSGFDPTGMVVSDIQGAELNQKRMEFCVKSNIPYAAKGKATWGVHDDASYDVGVVPLHDHDGKVAYLLCLICYFEFSEATSTTLLNITCSNLPPKEIEIFDQAFYFWVRSRGNARLPLKSEIDVTQIPRLLPRLVLYDVLEEPLDFRRRVIGEGVKAVLKPDYVMKTFREQPGKGPGSKIWSFFSKVVETGIPRYSRLEYEGPEGNISYVLNLLLPYSGDGRNVSHILNVVHFVSEEKSSVLQERSLFLNPLTVPTHKPS